MGTASSVRTILYWSTEVGAFRPSQALLARVPEKAIIPLLAAIRNAGMGPTAVIPAVVAVIAEFADILRAKPMEQQSAFLIVDEDTSLHVMGFLSGEIVFAETFEARTSVGSSVVEIQQALASAVTSMGIPHTASVYLWSPTPESYAKAQKIASKAWHSVNAFPVVSSREGGPTDLLKYLLVRPSPLVTKGSLVTAEDLQLSWSRKSLSQRAKFFGAVVAIVASALLFCGFFAAGVQSAWPRLRDMLGHLRIINAEHKPTSGGLNIDKLLQNNQQGFVTNSPDPQPTQSPIPDQTTRTP